MLSTSLVPARALTRGPDALASAAALAAVTAGAPLGLVWLEAAPGPVWGTAPGATPDVPTPDGPLVREVLPVLARSVDTARNLAHLGDHPDLAHLGEPVEGVVSVATAPLHDAHGHRVGLVAVFDHDARDWSAHLEALDLVAAVAAPSYRPSRPDPVPEATQVVAAAADAIERTLTSGAIQALVDDAAAGDARTRRRGSEAQQVLDRVSVLRGRLRSALPELLTTSRARTFDLVATVERATASATLSRSTTIPVSSPDVATPVSGDADRAHLAVSRAVAAALEASDASDVSVGVTTRSLKSERLEGSVYGEVSVTVRGAALAVGDLVPVVAALEGGHAGTDGAAAVSLQVGGGETRFVAAGFEASASPNGTWMTLRWPLDLG